MCGNVESQCSGRGLIHFFAMDFQNFTDTLCVF